MKKAKLTSKADYIGHVRERGQRRLRAIFSARRTPVTKPSDPDASKERWEDLKHEID